MNLWLWCNPAFYLCQFSSNNGRIQMKYVCNMRHVSFIKSVHISSSDLCFNVIKFEARKTHRVDRVLGFFSSRPNCVPHPLIRRRVTPTLVPGGHTRLRKWGWAGIPIWTRGQTLWYSRYSYKGTLQGDSKYVQEVLYVQCTYNREFFYNAQNFFSH
jgi:hypothetical protein